VETQLQFISVINSIDEQVKIQISTKYHQNCDFQTIS